jgi:hypothetical protein
MEFREQDVKSSGCRFHAAFTSIAALVPGRSIALGSVIRPSEWGASHHARAATPVQGSPLSRPATELPFTCVTCELAITGLPTFHVGLPFCCAGCVAGGPCTCSYDPEELEDGRFSQNVASEASLADDGRSMVATR